MTDSAIILYKIYTNISKCTTINQLIAIGSEVPHNVFSVEQSLIISSLIQIKTLEIMLLSRNNLTNTNKIVGKASEPPKIKKPHLVLVSEQEDNVIPFNEEKIDADIKRDS